jgi:hypothetical protein
MYRFEGLALLLTLAFLVIALQRAGVRMRLPQQVVHYGLWGMGIFFAVSVLGNLLSRNGLERWVMAPLALLMSLCALWLATH